MTVTETAADREDADKALSLLSQRVDRLADKTEKLTSLVGSLHTDAREALALGYAACESDVRLAFALHRVLSILDKWSRTLPSDLRLSEEILQADTELRQADQQIEQSVARFLADAGDRTPQ